MNWKLIKKGVDKRGDPIALVTRNQAFAVLRQRVHYISGGVYAKSWRTIEQPTRDRGAAETLYAKHNQE